MIKVDKSSLRRKAKLLMMFFAGQGSAQALNLLNGFLVLHWLDITSYGQYGLTFGFQSTVNMLIDLGFSTTIVALVGHRIEDRTVVGDYIRSGRSLRSRMLVTILPISAIVYCYITRHLQWGVATQLVLLLSIFVSIYFSGFQAYYSVALIIQRKLGIYYRIQIISALVRLIGCAILYKLGLLTAITAAWVNAFGITIAGLSYRHAARNLVIEPIHPNPMITRQMLRYVMPNIPGVVFFALQGQISVFLIAALGHNSGVARVAALSRLTQIFTLVSALNGTVLEPWFAKSPENAVLRRYLLAAGLTVFFSTLFVGFSIVSPGALLWILGKHYSDLRVEVRWTVLSGCTGYLMGMTWTAISGRRLIYWGTTFLNIGLILLTQVIFVTTIGVSTPLQAVQFGFASAAASLLAQLINLMYGLRRGPRVALVMEG